MNFIKQTIHDFIHFKSSKNSMIARLRITVLVLLLVLCYVLSVLAKTTFIEAGDYVAFGEKQQTSRLTITANRGTIYDANMEVLAQSATVWNVIISPMALAQNEEKKQKCIQELSGILGLTQEQMTEHMNKQNQYEILARRVEKEVVDKVRAFMQTNKIYCITLEESSKRFYPNSTLASAVLGFTGSDNNGLYGLEYYYDETLSGTDGYTITAVDGKGNNLLVGYEQRVDAENGSSLVLTIDSNIQYYLEKAMQEGIAIHQPSNGAAGIVMDVNTGKILGMASFNNFDCNDPYTVYDEDTLAELALIEDEDEYKEAYAAARMKQWSNKAISYAYQPGSVFKPITASAALECGTATLNSTYGCGGSYRVDDRNMRCVRTEGHGTETFTKAMIDSCNPSFIQIGLGLGSELFFRYFDSFGLTEKTGIDLPGEGVSQYYTADALTKVSLASCSFGQSTAVTPIQMITAFSAIVNGGYLVTPHVVSEVLDSNGNIIESASTDVKHQVISGETSATMRDILEQVVSANGGNNAYIKGYRIGGKSGTSQKQTGATESEDGSIAYKYISSFCAFAPADDPQVAVMIMVDEPTSGQIYGSAVAAPIVASVMEDVLPYVGIDKVYTDEDLEALQSTVPHVVGKTTQVAKNAMNQAELKIEIIGSGTTVLSQYPTVGQTMEKGGTVYLYTEEVTELDTVIVPNVLNLSPSQANAALTNAGLNVCIEGGAASNSGAYVISQSYTEGVEVERGTVVVIQCIKVDRD